MLLSNFEKIIEKKTKIAKRQQKKPKNKNVLDIFAPFSMFFSKEFRIKKFIYYFSDLICNCGREMINSKIENPLTKQLNF
jgi:hypothetical protein